MRNCHVHLNLALTTKTGTVMLSAAKGLSAHRERPFAALRVTNYYRSWLVKSSSAMRAYMGRLRHGRSSSSMCISMPTFSDTTRYWLTCSKVIQTQGRQCSVPIAPQPHMRERPEQKEPFYLNTR